MRRSLWARDWRLSFEEKWTQDWKSLFRCIFTIPTTPSICVELLCAIVNIMTIMTYLLQCPRPSFSMMSMIARSRWGPILNNKLARCCRGKYVDLACLFVGEPCPDYCDCVPLCVTLPTVCDTTQSHCVWHYPLCVTLPTVCDTIHCDYPLVSNYPVWLVLTFAQRDCHTRRYIISVVTTCHLLCNTNGNHILWRKKHIF